MSDLRPQLNPSSTLREHLRIGRNAAALALMLAGVACLFILHVMLINGERGWMIWVGLIDFIRHGLILTQLDALLGFSGFITLTVTTLISPLLLLWLARNAWIKWSLVVFAAMAAGIMWYFVLIEGELPMIILALAPTFTLAGLLCLKSTCRCLTDCGL